MVIKSCIRCEFHEIKENEKVKISYCRRENCYSRFSKCVSTKALKWYLEQGSSEAERSFSALDHVYSRE
jgi:hypothetical protein